MNTALPCPRFEFLWSKDGDSWTRRFCTYSLVIPLGELDIRSTDVDGNPRERRLEIGRTNVSGGNGHPPIYEGKVDTPFRDAAHAQWDCDALGGHIPIYAVCENTATLIPKQPRKAQP
jgi:hypothetical protein